MEPGATKAEQVGPADIKEFGGAEGIEGSQIEGSEGLADEIRGQALDELMLLFRATWEPGSSTRARHFVGLRYAQTSSMPGPRAGVSF